MLENNSNRLIFGAIAVVTAGAIYGTVHAAYPEATNQIIQKIQAPFSENDKVSSESISVVGNNPVEMTINVPYSKLPNGKYLSGTDSSDGVDVDGKKYLVTRTSDFDEFYNKYGKYFDDDSGIKLSNGLLFSNPADFESYSYSSAFGKEAFESASPSDLPQNNRAGELVLNASTGKIENGDDNSDLSVDVSAQIVKMATTSRLSPGLYASQPSDYDVSLQKQYVRDGSEDNLNLTNKLYPNFDFEYKQLYFINQGSILHVHYYEVPPIISTK